MSGFPDRDKCKLTSIPEDIKGKTVLDVGGYDGRMAKLMLQHGAAEAICVDNGQFAQYDGYKEPPIPDGIYYAHLPIEDYCLPADIVLAFDVLYHSKAPYRFLEKMAELTKETLCLSTRFVDGDASSWVLYYPNEQHPDPTVYWKPTWTGLEKLLKVVGFTNVVSTYHEVPGYHEPDGLAVVRCTRDG